MTINMVEVQWKEQLKLYFSGNKSEYNGFMGKYSLFTGITTILFSLFIGSNILKKLSWYYSAIITPCFILFTGTLFYSILISNKLNILKNIYNRILFNFINNINFY